MDDPGALVLGEDGFPHLQEAGLDEFARQHLVPFVGDRRGDESFLDSDATDGHGEVPLDGQGADYLTATAVHAPKRTASGAPARLRRELDRKHWETRVSLGS